MCITFLLLDRIPGTPVAILVNRDEFYARPTLPAHEWPGAAPFLAGEDQRSHGTWAGAGGSGRFAVLTNHRDFASMRPDARSRGDIVPAFLRGTASAGEYLEALRERRGEYNGFNVILGTPERRLHYASHEDAVHDLTRPGLYGLSNASLDTPWPKLLRGKERLEALLQRAPTPSDDTLLDVMVDATVAKDEELGADHPRGIALDRALSAIFVRTEVYGTGTSSLFRLTDAGAASLTERTFEAAYGAASSSPAKYRCVRLPQPSQ